MKREKPPTEKQRTQEYTYNSLRYIVSPDVYKPSEDTFLLAEILREDSPEGRLLEVGTGSGLLSLIAAKSADRIVATDINPHAVTTAYNNVQRNGLDGKIEILRCDLASALHGKDTFDSVIFNPPYLPGEESGKDWFARSWSGGASEVEFTERTLEETCYLLKPRGNFLFLISKEEGLERISKFVAKRGFALEVLGSRTFFYEKLFAVKAERTR